MIDVLQKQVNGEAKKLNNMDNQNKKLYCCNCRYYKPTYLHRIREFECKKIILKFENFTPIKKTVEHTIAFCHLDNKNNNCRYYKRKWYKFFRFNN